MTETEKRETKWKTKWKKSVHSGSWKLWRKMAHS